MKFTELIERISELEKSQLQPQEPFSEDLVGNNWKRNDKDRQIKMEKFTGSEIISGAQWLSGYEKLAKLYRWSDQWKAENFLLHLGGGAHNWYCSMALHEEEWPIVRQLFLDRYVLSKEDMLFAIQISISSRSTLNFCTARKEIKYRRKRKKRKLAVTVVSQNSN